MSPFTLDSSQKTQLTVTNSALYGNQVSLGISPDPKSCFQFSLAPKLSISGWNDLVERTINGDITSGVVVEQWARGSYSINLEGVFIDEGELPHIKIDKRRSIDDLVAELTSLLTARRELYIYSAETARLGIQTVAIKKWAFPFTAGTENQRFSIEAISQDVLRKLVLETQPLAAFEANPTTSGVLA